MATTLIVRTLRALPLYLLAVVAVLGLTQALHGTTVAAAETQPQPFVPASAPVHVTFVIGQVPMPVPVLVPPSQH